MAVNTDLFSYTVITRNHTEYLHRNILHIFIESWNLNLNDQNSLYHMRIIENTNLI